MNYNPLSLEVIENPYPFYDYLREHAPIYWIEPLQAWALSRYADVDFALRSPQIFPSSGFTDQTLGDLNPTPGIPWILDTNPPDHTRLRKLANKGFLPRLIRALEPRVQEITRTLIAELKSKAGGDLVTMLSGPLPITVIAEMLGVEDDRFADFKHWSDDVVLGTSRPTDEAVRARVLKSGAALREYFAKLIERRRTEPGEDVLSALVRAEEEHDMLTSDEILGLAVLLLLAGNETTTNLIGNATRNLLRYPDELAKVRADRSLIPSMIEEVLRYDSPVQLIPRRTAREVELEGGTIPAGATVFLLLASANRDERKFPQADRFDVTRNPQDHVAFGYGIHYCLGAPLARLEARVAFEQLLFDCPPFTCTKDPLPQIASVIVRGVQTLPLRFAA